MTSATSGNTNMKTRSKSPGDVSQDSQSSERASERPASNRSMNPTQADVERRFGVLPNFFGLAPGSPEITANLWGFARFAYLDNPLPSLFKERLFVYLSRFCDVRYCITRHVGFLVGLGRASGDAACPAQSIEDVIRLLRRPLPRGADLEPCVVRCRACDAPLSEMPAPGSAMELAMFACASHVFLQTPDASRCADALKRACGETRFQYLLVFLMFVRAAHYWTKVHTDLTIEEDLEELLVTHERLADCLSDDPEASTGDIGQLLLDELTELREEAAHHNETLRAQQRDSAERLRVVNAELAQRCSQLEQASAGNLDSRRAALNLMEDAVQSRRETEKLNAELGRSESNLRDFIENASVGLHWVGPDGTILWANQTEFDLLGYSHDEYVGHHIAEFHADQPVIDDILARLAAGETLTEHEACLRHKDGSLRHVLISSNALFEDDKFIHTRCFTRDITERKAAEDALREAGERKTEFLALLAHELRNPLAPIRNMLEIMKRSGNNPEIIEQARNTMDRQVAQMTRLIDDLLDVSRITRGKLELRKGRIELASAMHHAVEAVRPLVDGMQHDLTVTLASEPLYMDGDPTRLAQIVGNLLNNACKFTDRGGHIWLTMERDGDEAVIRVRDNGVGIAADQLPQIFKMFTQVDTSLERSVSGLGIGLALVRNLVAMHGGTVEAFSAGIGTGSEFVVRLPLMLAIQVVKPTGSDRTQPTAVARRILIVDDNRDSADTLARLMKMAGSETQTAYDGLEAVKAAEAFRPDVILMDIGLPKLNGYEAAREIRQQPWAKDMMLVALTGWGQEEDRRKSSDAGFNSHLVKPVDQADLATLLALSRPTSN
jgi:PAS domain S-box-containing protein